MSAMKVTMRVLVVAATTAVLLGAGALPAHALPVDATLVSSRTSSVTGYQLAQSVLRDMRSVRLSSSGATVTVDVAGEPHDLGIDLGDVAPTGSGIASLLAIAAVGMLVMRAAAMLVRLFG